MANPRQPIHGAMHVPAKAPPPTERCQGCREPSHVGSRCQAPEILALRRRVRELEAELREVRAEVAAERSKALGVPR